MHQRDASRRALARQALDLVAGRWVLEVAEQLAQRSPMRYGELVGAIADIAEGSLSRTLRQMERDGLVRRIAQPTMPMQVDYELTHLGSSAIDLLDVLAAWTREHAHGVEAAREAYDDPQD